MASDIFTIAEFANLLKKIQKKETTFIIQLVTLVPFHILSKELSMQYTFTSILTSSKIKANALHFIVDDCKNTALPTNTMIIFYSSNIFTNYSKVIIVDEKYKKFPIVQNCIKPKFEDVVANINENEWLLLFLIFNNENKLTTDEIRKEASRINSKFENVSFCLQILSSLKEKKFIKKSGTKYKAMQSRHFLEKLQKCIKI